MRVSFEPSKGAKIVMTAAETLGQVEINFSVWINPLPCHWYLLIPPENIRKTETFWYFQGYQNISVAWNELKWIMN